MLQDRVSVLPVLIARRKSGNGRHSFSLPLVYETPSYEPEQAAPSTVSTPQPPPLVLTPELVDALRAALAQVTVSEEPQQPQALPYPQGEQQANKDEQRANTAQEATAACDHEQLTNESEQVANNYERVKAYLAAHTQATDRAIAEALTISTSTANKWRKQIERASVEGECREQ